VGESVVSVICSRSSQQVCQIHRTAIFIQNTDLNAIDNLCSFSVMLKFLKQVSDYTKETFQAAKYIGQGLSVTFDHMQRRPVTVLYPYEKLIPSERYRGRIHFEFDKCISL
jgi:hypothetical protein